MLSVYLAGEIHSNWREEIIQLCEKEKLDVKLPLLSLTMKPLTIVV